MEVPPTVKSAIVRPSTGRLKFKSNETGSAAFVGEDELENVVTTGAGMYAMETYPVDREDGDVETSLDPTLLDPACPP